MVDRQLRWNRRTTSDYTDDSRLLEYYMVIVNDTREIKSIEMKICSQLEPIFEQSQSIKESLPQTNGLAYKYIQFKSKRSDFAPRNAYDGKVIRDTHLYPRERQGMLEEYVLKIIGAK